jgi:hypothetical protein
MSRVYYTGEVHTRFSLGDGMKTYHLPTTRHTWQDNIKMDYQDVGWDSHGVIPFSKKRHTSFR